MKKEDIAKMSVEEKLEVLDALWESLDDESAKDEKKTSRRFGQYEGQISMSEDFDDELYSLVERREIEAGLADSEAERITPVEDVMKEFRDECQQREEEITLARWEKYQETGETVNHEDVMASLKSWGSENKE